MSRADKLREPWRYLHSVPDDVFRPARNTFQSHMDDGAGTDVALRAAILSALSAWESGRCPSNAHLEEIEGWLNDRPSSFLEEE